MHEALLDSLNTAVLLIDEDRQVIYSNNSAEVLLGTSASQSEGHGISQILLNHREALSGLESCIQHQQAYTQREVDLQLLNGRRLHIDYTVAPLFSDEDERYIMELFPRDRLQRISREEEMLAKQETTRMLVKGLAHEIKNPLGGIRGAAQLLERALKDESLHEFTHIIMAESDRLRNLVDRMLGPNQLPLRAPLNIHEVIERVMALIEVESHSTLKLCRDYDPSLPEVVGDKEQLIQALLNVARNAMQALRSAGTQDPQITFRTRPLRQVTIGSRRHRLILSLEIIDNGPGIPEELRKNIFYPMVSGRAEGTGLGLSITQSIIGQHQGLVECDSEPGRTRFHIMLPLENNP